MLNVATNGAYDYIALTRRIMMTMTTTLMVTIWTMAKITVTIMIMTTMKNLLIFFFSAPPPELPPPSYELAMGGPQEIPSKSGYDYTFGKYMYAPKYPYYSFPDAGDPAHPPAAQGMYPPVSGDPAYPS